MDAQRRTAIIFVTQGVGCASCMCDWGITSFQDINILNVLINMHDMSGHNRALCKNEPQECGPTLNVPD